MSYKLKISIIQSDIYWENVDMNLSRFSELMKKMDDDTDVVILPEMFSTGFTMNAKKYAEDFNGKTFRWMKDCTARFNFSLAGSFIFSEGEGIFNRFVWMNPGGDFHLYDKRHLFRMGGETEHYVQGRSKLVIEFNNWKICPLICYDLRFPVWSRNSEGYDLLIYVANWPASRSFAWNTLLRARAIENQSYVAAANRIGKDGEGVKYSGESMILDPKGFPVHKVIKGKQVVISEVIDLQELKIFRKKFPVAEDADTYKIII